MPGARYVVGCLVPRYDFRNAPAKGDHHQQHADSSRDRVIGNVDEPQPRENPGPYDGEEAQGKPGPRRACHLLLSPERKPLPL